MKPVADRSSLDSAFPAVHIVAVFAENRPGWLARVTQPLAEAGLNIHWLGIASVERFGVIRLLVDRPDLAQRQLAQAGFTVSLVELLAAEVEDRPGALHRIARILGEEGLSLRNCSGFVFNQRAFLLLELDEPDRAGEVLGRHQVRLLNRDQLLESLVFSSAKPSGEP
jgi:hypothetical protein